MKKHISKILCVLCALCGYQTLHADPPTGTQLPATVNGNTITAGAYSLTLVSSGTLSNALLSGTALTISGTIPASQVSGLAASATTDTTNASNITSGKLAAAELGIFSGSGISISSGTIGVTSLVNPMTTPGDMIWYGPGGPSRFAGNTTPNTKLFLTEAAQGTGIPQTPAWGPVLSSDVSGLATVATSGSYASLLGLPTLATTGSSSAAGLSLTLSGSVVALSGTPASISGTLPRTQVASETYAATSISGTGNTMLIAAGAQNFNTVTLNSGTSPYAAAISLSDSNAVAGDLYELNVSLPASGNPTLNIYDSGTGGTLLTSIAGNGTAGATTLSFVNTGSSWVAYKKGAVLLYNNLSDLPSPATARTNIGAASLVAAQFQTSDQVVTNSTTLVSSTNCSVVLNTGTYLCESLAVLTNSSTTGLSKTQVNFTGSATQLGISVWRVFSTNIDPNGLDLTFCNQDDATTNYNFSETNFGSNRSMIIKQHFKLAVTTSGTLSIQFAMVTASGTGDTCTLLPSSYLFVTQQ
ncbi:MAG: hypothetical protein WCD79_20650 [Chthoniobacteraceae bacterium]